MSRHLYRKIRKKKMGKKGVFMSLKEPSRVKDRREARRVIGGVQPIMLPKG